MNEDDLDAKERLYDAASDILRMSNGVYANKVTCPTQDRIEALLGRLRELVGGRRRYSSKYARKAISDSEYIESSLKLLKKELDEHPSEAAEKAYALAHEIARLNRSLYTDEDLELYESEPKEDYGWVTII